MLSLLGERDAELLGEGLISLAGREERAGREAFAAQIYSALSEAPAGELSASVVERAARRLAALSGQGTVGDRAEVLARHFVQEATDPVTLLAMTVGSTAYAAARAGLLSRLIAAPSGALTRGLAARSLAAGGAFALEIPTFWATNKGLREALHPGGQSWDLASNARELATLGLSLGALKIAGFGATSVHARAGLRNPLSASLFRQAGMFTGILAGHGLERWAGLRPATDGATTLLESLVLLLQFNAGARLSQHLMGSRWAASQSALEVRLQAAIDRPRSTSAGWGSGSDRPFAMAMAGGEGGSGRRPGEGFDFNQLQISLSEGRPNGVPESGARVWQELFRSVVARGRRNEIEALKNLLANALVPQAEKSYIGRQLDRWRTKDPEEWKNGISRVTEMLEQTPAVLRAVQDIEGLREFKADWDSRPHFTKGSEVPVQLSKLTYNSILHRFVDKVREDMAARPHIASLRQLLNEPKNRTDISLRLERPDALGTTLYFNWRQVGFKARFTALGHLTGTIEVRQPFNQGESVAEIEALPAEPVQMPTSGRPRRKNRAAPAKPASRPTAPSPNYGPQRGENPTEWALRLLEASRSEDREASHQIVLEMERRLADPATQQMTREMVERLVVLTGPDSHSPRSGLVARQYQVSSLRSPITIVSEPTTFLPDPWSQVFAEGLATVKREGVPQVPLAIEAGSGTGWASIVLSRLGLAREIVATDLNPRAPALGRVNAALNGVSNVRFLEGNLLENLPAEMRADLIFACLPQVRKNEGVQGLREIADYYDGSGASYFDRFGLGLIEQTLAQARGRLQPDGRILLNLGGRPGRAVLEDLLASQGFQPRLHFSRMIPQDAGTDISGLARQESQTGFRFEFFRPDNATESISAAEAMTIQNPHHMLYLMEGRPYSDLLRQGLELRLKEGGRFGYTAGAGYMNGALREGLARELSRDFGFRLTPEVLHLGPDADTVLEGLLQVLSTERGLVFAGNGADVPRPLEPYTPRLVAPEFPAIEMALGEANPSVLVLQLPRDAWPNRDGLNQLLRNSAARGIHTVVLEDQPMRLPNVPHPLFEVLSASLPAAEHTHLVHSLDRRYATPVLPLAALVSGNRLLQFHMNRYSDLTHSQASSLIQDVYARFFERAGESQPLPEGLPGVLDSILTSFTPSERVGRALESKAAFESSPRGEHPDPIALNFGESEWAPRFRLGEGLWEAVQIPRPELESRARQAVAEYLLQSRGVRVEPGQIILGAGVHPLLVSAVRGLRDIGGGSLQVAVPRPSYGLFFPTVELGGAKMVEYSTRPEARFLTERGALLRELNNGSRLSAVLINEPNNPAGQFHSPESLRSIAQQIRSARGYLLFDDVFGLLDFGRGRQRRTPSMSLLQQELGSRLVAFGGVSKEFAAGGLRFGFAVVGDPRLAQAMQIHAAPSPDPLALTIAPAMLSHWRPLVEEHRTYLSSRAYQLEQVFRERELPILEAQGGYSLLANLEFLYGRRMRLNGGGEAIIGPDNLNDLLYSEAGLKVYSDAWARQPHHYRLVFSIDRAEEAANRLRKFFRGAR